MPWEGIGSDDPVPHALGDGENPIRRDIAVHPPRDRTGTGSIDLVTRPARGWEGIAGLAEPGERQALDDLQALLPSDPAARGETVREAIAWLSANLGDPRLTASRCADFGPTIAGLGVPPQRLEALAMLLVDALRANPPSPPLRADEEAALRDAGRLVARWLESGAAGAAHEPTHWSAVVTQCHRRRVDLAELTLRTYLPYPCPPGMRAVVEAPRLPGRWRECWVGSLPETDRTVRLHVPLYRGDPIGAELVERTGPGDRLRLRVPVGEPADLSGDGPLLFVAHRDAVAPVVAALTALRASAPEPARRDVTVYWPTPVERDAYRLAGLAPPGTLVIRDRFPADGADAAADGRDWSGHRAFVAGTAVSTADDADRIARAGVPAARTVIAAIG
ncbi:hypothetical protein [Dactylosporangium sp. CA-139066]|uniref:hypothetical protein n=1 Tax=Dactylosporangium sp. CA-139066 TaxID=3239930 RepID=UPI003D8C1ADC